MSGSAGGGGDHGGGQLYGDHQPAAAGSVPLYHGDDVVDSIFFWSSACCRGDDGSVTPPYSSINDYLQGFLDPSGLTRHYLDAPPRFLTGGAAVERGPAVGDVISGAAAPGTVMPNSVTSSEAAVAEEAELRLRKRRRAELGEADEEGSADHGNYRSDAKEKKKNKGEWEKQACGSRVAFVTKSEVDHLDDGYRWRKYGQKAVKNNSFPRSYFRCTEARCGVKKQVERSQQDPSTVVTTYEGHHTHLSPIGAHCGPCTLMATGAYSLATLARAQLQPHQHDFGPSPDDILLAAARARAMVSPAGANVYARMCTPPSAPPAAAASAVAPLPHEAERQLAEYYRLQLQHLRHDSLIGNYHGHR